MARCPKYRRACHFKVHQLVWAAWGDRAPNPGEFILHDDTQPLDEEGCYSNAIQHLRLGTQSENMKECWTVGAKSYYDIKAQKASETDVVALYQNPCRCWSLGLFYMIFPDRTQYNFMISLTGVGWTENFGTAVVKSLLSPLLIGERGLPWAAPGGPYGMQPATPSAPPGPTQP